MLTGKFFSLSHDEDHEVAWSQNPMVYKHKTLWCTYIHGLDENQLEKLNFINLDRYPICRVVVEPRAEIALLNLDRY